MMKLKLSRNHIIVLIIALLFILYGIAQAIFGFNMDKKYIDTISFILLIGAFAILFRGKKNNSKKEHQKEVKTGNISESKNNGVIEDMPEMNKEEKANDNGN